MKLKYRIIWLTAIALLLVILLVRIYAVRPAGLEQLFSQTQSAQSNQGTSSHAPASSITPTPTPPPLRPNLAAGMIFPQWGPRSYTTADKNWEPGLKEIRTQTGANWIGLYLQFHQDSEFTTNVHIAHDGQTPAGLKAGIEMAHKMGYRVYVFPAITLDNAHAWGGYIRYDTDVDNQAWFDNYWHQLQPFLQACQQAKCDRFSIGNEYEGLEQSPDSYWHQLLTRVHSVYPGQIVYSRNFSSQLKYPVAGWMRDPLLSEVGLSSYYSLIDTETSIPKQQLPDLWKNRVQPHLDAMARDLGKPVFISEIGYRNTSYAGYLPYQDTDNGVKDPTMQAALLDAAFQNIAKDKLIDGVFVWAWSKPPFAPNYTPAAKTIHHWYDVFLR
ncbi:hypothetical protein KDA_02890 [Dictyobacter alpinus]|uniref:Uncharacterized protein n=1 Tax=Dictyobacter alpinus TaxID=2014873 RepID=A0A402B0B9_9CHLR|nr:hypothetical protein [Dictyobacter alpinus]GCE24805.1 hypothetical protein KDA_02890 [Dictyobacter alpinus]